MINMWYPENVYIPFEVFYMIRYVNCNNYYVSFINFNYLQDLSKSLIILVFRSRRQETPLFAFSHFRNLLDLN
jgi:hypothetical protein